ncbi:nitroreductase/quinone reductase family protein [Streptomyces hesseae]|uniref:Nitroreductase/quinone reductase family protein n=1 Tax=Streptomyces hesseae TaxID=3075519 RepID=A0ABU2SFS6_9ACTN|nr:nitroreductase/quinone reductase family protein [Streptomyces sp. DSM 40473]MDT0447805.1 nitroreductase/quinone reductase family protein [Streptomyces sp. DSM 40473]
MRFLNQIATSRWAGGPMRAMVPLDAALQRRTKGRLSIGRAVGLHSLLLNTTGARTGQPRQVPLFHVPYEHGFAVIGSNLGGDNHPAWSSNLLKYPYATVITRGKQFRVLARETHGPEREEIWLTILTVSPGYAAYDARCSRSLRIFVLQPVPDEADALPH